MAATDRSEAGVVGADPDLLQFAANVPGCPGGLSLIGGTHVQQGSVGQRAEVDAIGRAERGEGRMPCSSFLRTVPSGFRSNRVGRLQVSVQLAVGADLGCSVLPVQPVERVAGNCSECRAMDSDSPRSGQHDQTVCDWLARWLELPPRHARGDPAAKRRRSTQAPATSTPDAIGQSAPQVWGICPPSAPGCGGG